MVCFASIPFLRGARPAALSLPSPAVIALCYAQQAEHSDTARPSWAGEGELYLSQGGPRACALASFTLQDQLQRRLHRL